MFSYVMRQPRVTSHAVGAHALASRDVTRYRRTSASSVNYNVSFTFRIACRCVRICAEITIYTTYLTAVRTHRSSSGLKHLSNYLRP